MKTIASSLLSGAEQDAIINASRPMRGRHPGEAESSHRSDEPPVINDAAVIKRFHRIAIETATTCFDKRLAYAGGGNEDSGFYPHCVPSSHFGNEQYSKLSDVRTPAFIASDGLLGLITELMARYRKEALNS